MSLVNQRRDGILGDPFVCNTRRNTSEDDFTMDVWPRYWFFTLNENSAVGTFVGQVTASGQRTAPVIYEIDDPSLPNELRLAADDHLSGDPAASLVLIEYLDFQCPTCQTYHPIVQQLEQEFAGDLLVVSRYFPLTSVHFNAYEAAAAAEAAGRQGMFDEMGDLLFQHQAEWGPADDPLSFFEDYAVTLGLDLTQLLTDMCDPAVDDRILRDTNAAAGLGATATPPLLPERRPSHTVRFRR